MTPHFSDELHMETCAGKYCNDMKLRSEMTRINGKRGWFCNRCYTKHYWKIPGQGL